MGWSKLTLVAMLAGSTALVACGGAGVTGARTYPSHEADQADRRAELVRQASALAAAGDCAGVKTRGAELRALSGGTLHDLDFLGDEHILDCYSRASVAAAPSTWFCTSSTTDDLCFCWQLESECAAERRLITELGATMNACVSSQSQSCRVSAR